MTSSATIFSDVEVTPRSSPISWPALVELGIQPPRGSHDASAADEETASERLVRHHPHSPTALARLAREQLSSAQVPQAIASSRHVLDMDAQDAAAVVVALQVLTLAGETDVVERYLGHWLRGDVGSRTAPVIAIQLAVSLMARRGDLEAALSLLRSESVSPHSEDHQLAGVLASAQAALLMSTKRYEAAVHELRVAMNTSPANPADYVNLGYALAMRGALRKAIRATQVAVQLAPADRLPSFNLASLLIARGDWRHADQVLRRLSHLRPSDPKVDIARVGFLIKSGEPKRALSVVGAAMSRSEQFRGTDRAELIALADIARLRLGRLTENELRARLVRLLATTDPPSGRLALAVAQMTHDPEQSEMLRDIRQRLGPTPEGVSLGIDVQIAITSGELRLATELSRSWLRTDPFSAPSAVMATYLIGMVEGRLHESIRIGEDFLRRSPGDAVLRNNVSFAKVLVGDLAGAERVLEMSDSLPLTYCTAALIALARGNAARSEALYARAVERVRDDGTVQALLSLYREAGQFWFGSGQAPSFEHLASRVRRDSRIDVLRHAWDSWMRDRRSLD